MNCMFSLPSLVEKKSYYDLTNDKSNYRDCYVKSCFLCISHCFYSQTPLNEEKIKKTKQEVGYGDGHKKRK